MDKETTHSSSNNSSPSKAYKPPGTQEKFKSSINAYDEMIEESEAPTSINSGSAIKSNRSFDDSKT